MPGLHATLHFLPGRDTVAPTTGETPQMCTSSPPKPKATPSVPIIQPEIQNQQTVQAGVDEMRRRQAAGGAASTIIAGAANTGSAGNAAPTAPTTSAKTLLGS